MSTQAVREFIDLIKQDVNDDVMVFIPSQQKEVKFKPISVAQQKEIIKQSLGGVKGTILISKTFNDIIQRNCQEKIDIYLSDRNAILVQLRIASLGNNVTDHTGKKTTLSFSPIADLKEHKATINYKDINVEVDTPSLIRDSTYYAALAAKTFENAGEVVNDMYSAEVAKFIKTISFVNTTCTPTAVADSIALVDALPTALNSQILNFIKNVKDYDSAFLNTANGNYVLLNAGFFNDPQ